MADSNEWEDRAKEMLKAELRSRDVTYAGPDERLTAIGIVDSGSNIRNKLAPSKFTAVF